MNKPSTTSSEAVELEGVATSLDDPQAFAHETTFELTEVVEDDEPEDSMEIPVTIDCPEERFSTIDDANSFIKQSIIEKEKFKSEE